MKTDGADASYRRGRRSGDVDFENNNNKRLEMELVVGIRLSKWSGGGGEYGWPRLLYSGT